MGLLPRPRSSPCQALLPASHAAGLRAPDPRCRRTCCLQRALARAQRTTTVGCAMVVVGRLVVAGTGHGAGAGPGACVGAGAGNQDEVVGGGVVTGAVAWHWPDA